VERSRCAQWGEKGADGNGEQQQDSRTRVRRRARLDKSLGGGENKKVPGRSGGETVLIVGGKRIGCFENSEADADENINQICRERIERLP